MNKQNTARITGRLGALLGHDEQLVTIRDRRQREVFEYIIPRVMAEAWLAGELELCNLPGAYDDIGPAGMLRPVGASHDGIHGRLTDETLARSGYPGPDDDLGGMRVEHVVPPSEGGALFPDIGGLVLVHEHCAS